VSFLERMDNTIRRSPVWRSIFRQPYPNDERSRAYAVMNNVFLHIHPVRVRQHAVKFAYTFCLGGLSFFLFLVLTITGGTCGCSTPQTLRRDSHLSTMRVGTTSRPWLRH
jgi:hypothetical protein